MRLKYEFSINQIGDNYVAVPLGSSIVSFNGILKLNQEAAYIIETLNSDITYDKLLETVAEHFACDVEEAKENVDSIVSGLKEADLLAE